MHVWHACIPVRPSLLKGTSILLSALHPQLTKLGRVDGEYVTARRDIERVWRMSGEKYWANRQDILIAMGPEWSIWDDLPSQPNEVTAFW